MSRGLEALHHPRIKSAKVDISSEGKHDIAYMLFDYTKQYTIIEKELKALEIIKEMFNDGNYLVRFNGHSYYIWDNVLMATSCEITKEQYDLLKEVLL